MPTPNKTIGGPCLTHLGSVSNHPHGLLKKTPSASVGGFYRFDSGSGAWRRGARVEEHAAEKQRSRVGRGRGRGGVGWVKNGENDECAPRLVCLDGSEIYKG
jgi:hypothetical protein